MIISSSSSQYPENYPEEYLTGTVSFFGRVFKVIPAVLIPRLETESLIRRARKVIQAREIRTIIDIGCGSGIIGCSLADLVDEVVFLDISQEALTVTEENFHAHFPKKKGEYIVSDLLSHMPLWADIPRVLLANLPYIRV
jgi:release factor glutamine methyltransferase